MKSIRYIAALIAVLAAFSLLAGLPSSALKTPELTENDAVILCHNESGTVVYRSGAGKKVQAGPGVRLMAALVIAEAYKDDMHKTVTVNRRVLNLAPSTLNPGLKTGEQIAVYDLLCAALIANSNDALFALAFDMYEDAAAAPSRLIAAMNDKAKALGMEHTDFADLTGSDPADEEDVVSTTSIEDLLKLALEVQKNGILKEICAMPEYTIEQTDKSPKRTILTRNYMLSAKRIPGFTYSYARGLAAQNGKQSGYSAIGTADYGGKTFTCIVIGSKDEYGAFKDAKELFIWANKNFTYRTVLEKTRILGEIRVVLSGDADYVTLSPKESVAAFLPNDVVIDEEIEIKTHLSFTELTAPVHEGLIAGKATVLYNGRELAQVDLVTTSSLLLSNSRYYLALFLNFVSSPAFIWTCAAILLLLLIYVLINARMRYLRKQRPASLTFEIDDGKEEPYIGPALGQSGVSEEGNKELTEKKETPEKKAGTGKPAQKSVPGKAKKEKLLTSGEKTEKQEDESAVHVKKKSTEEEQRAAKKAEEDYQKRGRNDYVPEGWGKKDGDD